MRKSIPIAIGLAITGAFSSFGQGTIDFSFFGLGTNGIQVMWAPAPNPWLHRGCYCGSDYSVAAYMGPANSGLLTFVPDSLVAFFGAPTSPAGNPAVDGAGLFGGRTIVTPFPPGSTATIQVRVWYNGGRFPTFEAAAAAERNCGSSQLYQIPIADPISPIQASLDTVGMQAFQVGILGAVPRTINITSIQVTNGTVTINFYDGSPVWDYDVLASENVNGPYLPVSIVLSSCSGYPWSCNTNYQATLPVAGDAQFYRLQRR